MKPSARSSPGLRTPSFRLDGRMALVTGAGRGIGLAAAHALAQAGAHVHLVARTMKEVEAACADIRTDGGQATPGRLDVTDSSAVAAHVARTGPFDILVNNAGTNRPSLITEMQDADYDQVMDLNVRATMFVTREVARGMVVAGRGGSIITVSSQMGHVGGPKRALYCASKHAVEGMTKALAWELGPHGIRVNTLCPTFIETPLTAPMLADPAFRAFAEGGTALGRVGRLDEVMGAVVFLASDASTLVTGSALMVDGGWTAR
jgi:NAD(P)-dependent dehydrogenase (short-subunit alcohol dehydrogenase family)